MPESAEFISRKNRKWFGGILLRIASITVLSGGFLLSACRTPVESVAFPTSVPTYITNQTGFDDFPRYWELSGTNLDPVLGDYCDRLSNYRENQASPFDSSNGVYMTSNLLNELSLGEEEEIQKAIISFNKIIPSSCQIDKYHPVLFTLIPEHELYNDNVVAYVPIFSNVCGEPQIVLKPQTIRDISGEGDRDRDMIGTILSHELAHTCPGDGPSSRFTVTVSNGEEYIISGRLIFRAKGEMFPILEEVFASLVALNSIVEDSNFKEYESFRDIPEMEGLAYRGAIWGLEEILQHFGYNISPYALTHLFVSTADREYPLLEIAILLDKYYYSEDPTTKDFDILEILTEYAILNSQVHNEFNSGQDPINN